MTFRRTRCPHCKAKLEAGQRIHVECIDGYADAQAEKLKRAEAKRERAAARVERAETRRRKEADKTWSDHHADAQKSVNAMVRTRDVGLPCISCGTPWEPTFQAGHYRSRGAAKNLALDPKNIHGQCVQCNLHKHSNALDYRLGLIGRYGLAFVEAIEADNEARHHSIDDLKAIRAEAIAKTNQLKKENAL
jgi:hypothetical protein